MGRDKHAGVHGGQFVEHARDQRLEQRSVQMKAAQEGIERLAAMNPAVLVPAHCTGWRAQHAMAARFPAAFVPNAVGSRFYL